MHSIAVKMEPGLPPEVGPRSVEEQFFVAAVHYYRTKDQANYPRGTMAEAARAYGFNNRQATPLMVMASDYVSGGCAANLNSRFRKPAPMLDVTLEAAA